MQNLKSFTQFFAEKIVDFQGKALNRFPMAAKLQSTSVFLG